MILMLHNTKGLNKTNLARRKSVLAFFISTALLILYGCSFDNDSDGYESKVNSKLRTAKVVKVKDGDSVILRFEDSKEKEARLFGIDAPEYNQAFGRDAKKILSKLLLKKTVFVESRGVDRYEREIVILTFDRQQTSANLLMIKQGAAWVYSRYQNDKTWSEAQKLAKQKSLGLWANRSAIAPWDWREREQARRK